jgi:hypothetical protein
MCIKRLFVPFIVTPLTFCYSDHPSASILLYHIDADLIQKVLNEVLCWFPLCHTSHHALCYSCYMIQEFDENVCQKLWLRPSRPAPGREWWLWLGPALEKAKAASGQAGPEYH